VINATCLLLSAADQGGWLPQVRPCVLPCLESVQSVAALLSCRVRCFDSYWLKS
jgi:hypothetical protein